MEEDPEGAVVEEVVGVHMTHLLEVVAEEEGQMVQMMNALEVEEDTSCLEEVGALLHLV